MAVGGGAEREAKHGDLVNLSAGRPSEGAPEPVRAPSGGLISISRRHGALGIPELRAEIAA